MLQRTNKIFIGKDIDRSSGVTEGLSMTGLVVSGVMAEGEIVLLDKDKKVLASGATISDTDVIYVCQALNTTYDYTTEDGTAVSASVKVRISDPIEGKKVKSYTAKAYSAAAQQVSTFDCTGVVPVTGTEYVLRVVYKDIWEHPGQFTATYRFTPTAAQAASLATFVVAFVAKINTHKGRRILASTNNTTTIVLTGLTIPQCTTGLNDLDVFTMVEFKPFLDYVSVSASGAFPAGSWTQLGYTSYTLTTTASKGSGMWEDVRDIERQAWGYSGITNRTHYPILLPDVCTVVGATYNIITIEHDASYLSPDNQYVKQAPLTTQIAFRVPSTSNDIAGQQSRVLSQLNGYFASCPGNFNAITL